MIRESCGHRDCTCGAHGYDTSSAHVQMVDADAFDAVAAVAGRVDDGMDVRARRRVDAAPALGVLPDMSAVGMSVDSR